MFKSAVSKVMWVGRATVFLVGLAVILALVLGVATSALGANGGNFILGKGNAATAITKLAGAAGVNGPMLQLINNNADPNDTALDLRVQSGEAPMRVNSGAKVTNLNADELDGKNANEIAGVNGLARIGSASAENSLSPKSATASCPSGRVVIGTGANIFGGKSGDLHNTQTDVVIDEISPFPRSVQVVAYEEQSTSADWSVTAYAICATAP